MSEKQLTEAAWKTFASNNMVKDASLQKALAKFSACKQDDYEGLLKGLKEIENCAVGMPITRCRCETLRGPWMKILADTSGTGKKGSDAGGAVEQCPEHYGAFVGI